MKYRCLRDCFVFDRLHKEGEVYEFEGKVPESCFKPIEEEGELPFYVSDKEPKRKKKGA